MENEAQNNIITENEILHKSYLSDEINSETNFQISIDDLEPTFKKSSLMDYMKNIYVPKFTTKRIDNQDKRKEQTQKSNSNLEITIIDESSLSSKQQNTSNDYRINNSIKPSQNIKQAKKLNANCPPVKKNSKKLNEVETYNNKASLLKNKKKELKNDIMLFLSGANKGSLLRALSSSRNSKEIFPGDLLKNKCSIAGSKLKSTEETTNKCTTCSRITSHKKRKTENFNTSKDVSISFDQFYEKQLKAQSLIKIKNLEKSILKLEFPTFKPLINANSIKVSNSKPNKENSNSCDPPKKYCELIKEKSNSLPPSFDNNGEGRISHIPSINENSKELKRDKEIFSHLYNEVYRKKSKQNEIEGQIDKMIKKSVNQSHVLSKSHQYLFDRFISEFNEAYNRSSSKKIAINYIELVCLLSMLGFVNLAKPNQCKLDKMMIFEIWKILKGEDYSGITQRNIKVFLLSIMGFYSEWMNSSDLKTMKNIPYTILEEEDQEESRNFIKSLEIGRFCEATNNFMVSKSEATKIHSHFNSLYVNKMNYDQSLHNIGVTDYLNKNTHTFHPKINQKSKILSDNFVKKTLGKVQNKIGNIQINKISREDFLTLKGIEYESKFLNQMRLNHLQYKLGMTNQNSNKKNQNMMNKGQNLIKSNVSKFKFYNGIIENSRNHPVSRNAKFSNSNKSKLSISNQSETIEEQQLKKYGKFPTMTMEPNIHSSGNSKLSSYRMSIQKAETKKLIRNSIKNKISEFS